jgi:hypothetical protein
MEKKKTTTLNHIDNHPMKLGKKNRVRENTMNFPFYAQILMVTLW